jgi:queuine/archaeosine tRNA-ribosyltransferase
MKQIRIAIKEREFDKFKRDFEKKYSYENKKSRVK